MASRDDRILSNPLRVRILDAITSGPASASELSADTGAAFAVVAYHTRVLQNAESIHTSEDSGPDPSDPVFEAGP